MGESDTNEGTSQHHDTSGQPSYKYQTAKGVSFSSDDISSLRNEGEFLTDATLQFVLAKMRERDLSDADGDYELHICSPSELEYFLYHSRGTDIKATHEFSNVLDLPGFHNQKRMDFVNMEIRSRIILPVNDRYMRKKQGSGSHWSHLTIDVTKDPGSRTYHPFFYGYDSSEKQINQIAEQAVAECRTTAQTLWHSVSSWQVYEVSSRD